MKLISMTDFVIEKHDKYGNLPYKEIEEEFDYALKLIASIRNYADLLKKTLNLDMFIPVDLEGNILEEPEQYNLNDSFYKMQKGFNEEVKYIEAKYRVLFDGFTFTLTPDDKFSKYKISNGNITFYEAGLSLSNVESMIQKVEIILTENAIKQLGL